MGALAIDRSIENEISHHGSRHVLKSARPEYQNNFIKRNLSHLRLGIQNQPVTGGGFTLGVGLGASAGGTYGPTILGPVVNPFDSQPAPQP